MIAQLLFAWFLIADNWLEARIGRELLYKRSTVFSNPMSLLTDVSRLTKENNFFFVAISFGCWSRSRLSDVGDEKA